MSGVSRRVQQRQSGEQHVDDEPEMPLDARLGWPGDDGVEPVDGGDGGDAETVGLGAGVAAPDRLGPALDVALGPPPEAAPVRLDQRAVFADPDAGQAWVAQQMPAVLERDVAQLV